MPAEASGDRLRRILVMVPWIMAHEGCTVTQVCQRFEIARDDVVADMEMLSMCGLPPFTPADLIDSWIDGDLIGISMASYLARPPRLSRAEAIALLVMGRALAKLPGMPEAASLASALEKLDRAIAPGEKETVRALVEVIGVELGGAGVDLLPAVRDAIERQRRIRMTYWSAGRGAIGERDVDPLLLFTAEGNWYLVARDVGSGEERSFRVDRIKDLTVTEEAAITPDGFDPSRYADGARYTPAAGDIEVQIDVHPEARWLVESIPADRADELVGDRVRLHIRTRHLDWLVALLLSAGTGARAVAPASLVEQVRETAQRALANYEG